MGPPSEGGPDNPSDPACPEEAEMIQTKREKITMITLVKQAKVTGVDKEPGEQLSVPGDLPESDAHRLVQRGYAIIGDGSGNAAEYVAKAVADHKAVKSARSARREQLKPVSNREVLNAILEMNKNVIALLGAKAEPSDGAGDGGKKTGK
jgi:hypothetical protein